MPDGDHTARYSHAGALTRRAFVVQGAACSGAVWLLASCDRVRPSQEQRKVLTANEWNMVSAITGCIIPTDHEPGALGATGDGGVSADVGAPDIRDPTLLARGQRGAAGWCCPGLRLCTHLYLSNPVKTPFPDRQIDRNSQLGLHQSSH